MNTNYALKDLFQERNQIKFWQLSRMSNLSANKLQVLTSECTW